MTKITHFMKRDLLTSSVVTSALDSDFFTFICTAMHIAERPMCVSNGNLVM